MRRGLERNISELKRAGLFRDPSSHRLARATEAATELGVPLLDAASNDYLGFSAAPLALEGRGGAGASRLIHAEADAHRDLERCVAEWVSQESALQFSSGYAANVGSIAALAGPDDLIISDELNHASLIDGCRLARAKVAIFNHLNLEHARDLLTQSCRGKRLIVVESYYSMDGDGPDLTELQALAREYDAALIVDEAHAIGVFGPSGAGLCAAAGVEADVQTLGFGKAIGLQGACVAGSQPLRDWLYNRARSFVYSTATSPALTRATTARVQEVMRAEDERRRLASVVTSLRGGLEKCGLQVIGGGGPVGPIIPILIGASELAMRAADHLIERGIVVQAIRPPTVPAGSARIRLTAKAWFDEQAVERLVDGVVEACGR
jgi:8-amino-7-oxononanoate synthase